MNIIFAGAIKDIPNGYTMLELDTFRFLNENRVETAYCVLENIGLSEFSTLEQYKTIHQDLMQHFKSRHWDYCEHAINGLMGHWGGQLDTFYVDLLARVLQYKEKEPPPEWDGTRVKI